MKIKKHVFGISLALILSLSLTSCGIATVDNKTYTSPKEFKISEDFTIAQSGEYSFDFASDAATVVLKNSKEEIVWATSPLGADKDRIDEYGDPIPLHSKVKSPIVIEYIDPSTSKIYTAYSYKDSTENGTYSVENIDNGIRVTYYFEEFKISVPVEYTFKDNIVRISVDSSKITESDYLLYSVAIAPYSCGVYNLSKNGYLFLPSGSGAIIEPCQLEMGSYTYSRELYGNDATRYAERELDTDNFPENRLAVYGAKIGADSAICAIIEKGAEHAFIEADIGATNTGYSSVWAKFAFRAYQWSKIKNEQQVKLYSKDMSQDTVSVAYHLLSGKENAGYVGMANTYRNYLIDTYAMNSKADEALLNLKIVGGVNVTETFLGFKYDDFFKTTTLAQAKDIISDLKKNLNVNMNVDLIGFGESGIDVGKIAGGYKVNGSLGGEKGLKELAEYAENNDCNLFFNADVLGVSKSGVGVNKSFDTALAQNKQKIKQYYYNIYLRKKTADHKPYLLVARELIPEICEKLTDEFSGTGIKGIGLDTLSSVCYSDYRNVEYFNKGNMASQVSKEMTEIKKNYAIAVNAANDYAAASADFIYDIPLTSSKNNIFSYDVPFYGIVFKGYIPFASSSVNLTSDYNRMILAAAEVGSGLSYTLINQGGTELFDSFSSAFYGSVYEGIKPEMLNTVKAYQNDFESVKSAKIVNHEVLKNGLHKTDFDNNVTVYTNYTTKDLYVGEKTVESGKYLFVKE